MSVFAEYFGSKKKIKELEEEIKRTEQKLEELKDELFQWKCLMEDAAIARREEAKGEEYYGY